MHPSAHPDGFTWFCAVLVASPAVVALVAGAGLAISYPEALAGPAGVGAALGLVGSQPLLAAEYRSVVRRSRRASLALACLLLYGAVMGSVAWLAGLLDVLHLKPPNHDSMSRGEFALYSAFLVGLIVAGAGHLRWYRLIRAATSGTD